MVWDPTIGFGRDDTKALSRTAGFVKGFTSGLTGELDKQRQEKSDSVKALRALKDNSIYPSIPGKDANKLLPDWNPETPYPAGGVSSLIAQYGQGKRMPLQEKAKREAQARLFAHQMALADKKGDAKFDPYKGHQMAKQLLDQQYLDISDPYGAQLYENAYNQYAAQFQIAPQALFDYSGEVKPGAIGEFFGQDPKPRPLFQAPTGPAQPRTPNQPRPQAPPPANDGWSAVQE